MRDNVLHCIPWGEAASTDVELVPDESGVRFTRSLGPQPVSTYSTKRVLTCPYMSDLRNGQSEMLPSSGAVQLQNLIPFASVSAEDSIDLCNPVSADPSELLQVRAVTRKALTNTYPQLPAPFAALKVRCPANCIRSQDLVCKGEWDKSF